jgi:hypothetical protein
MDLSEDERQLLLAGLYELSIQRGGPDADMMSLVMRLGGDPRAVLFAPPTGTFTAMTSQQRDVYLLTLEGRDTSAIARILGMDESAVAQALAEAEQIAQEDGE